MLEILLMLQEFVAVESEFEYLLCCAPSRAKTNFSRAR